MKDSLKALVTHIKDLYPNKNFIPLHEPCFISDENEMMQDCIKSTFVSSVGEYIVEAEAEIAKFTGSQYAVATVNGTAALEIILKILGNSSDSEVITTPITFVATCNAIRYCNSNPVFVDIDLDDLGLSPQKLEDFLKNNCQIDSNGKCINKLTKKIISTCVVVHIFGHSAKTKEIKAICKNWNIELVEDCAESLGSLNKKNLHTGLDGIASALSFNGNKIITSGGGGMIFTNNEDFAKKAKHLTTTAKVNHSWEYIHDDLGYNYRMPNLNAALLVSQLKKIDEILCNKRKTANLYKDFCEKNDIKFLSEPTSSKSNYWLNAIILEGLTERDEFLEYSNTNGVMTRPIWKPMHYLEMYKNCYKQDLNNSVIAYDCFVNIPSSYRG